MNKLQARIEALDIAINALSSTTVIESALDYWDDDDIAKVEKSLDDLLIMLVRKRNRATRQH